jgi:hypothetical protein
MKQPPAAKNTRVDFRPREGSEVTRAARESPRDTTNTPNSCRPHAVERKQTDALALCIFIQANSCTEHGSNYDSETLHTGGQSAVL